MNEYMNWELARMKRAEYMQEAEASRRANSASRARRIPLIGRFRTPAGET